MTAALEQAAHDRHLYTAEWSMHFELTYPEYVTGPGRARPGTRPIAVCICTDQPSQGLHMPEPGACAALAVVG